MTEDTCVSGDASETQKLAFRLLDAVKQCQIRFGGRTELATECDSSVSCLCAQFEAVLQHGLRRNGSNVIPQHHLVTSSAAASSSALASSVNSTAATKGNNILNVRDVMTSLNLNFKSTDNEPVFWEFIREFLTRHEQERYILLKNIGTDVGRGRAWLRSSLNEHSLERYMNMFLVDLDQLARFYCENAFMRDQEKSSLLPNVAAGLGSILFAININGVDLNSSKGIVSNSMTTSVGATNSSNSVQIEEPSPIFANPNSDLKSKDKRKKKRVPTQIVSFEEEEEEEEERRLSDSERSKYESVLVFTHSAPPTCLSSPTDVSRTATSEKYGNDLSNSNSQYDTFNSCCGDEYHLANGILTNWEYRVSESQVESVRTADLESSSSTVVVSHDNQVKTIETMIINNDSVMNPSKLLVPLFATYFGENKRSPDVERVQTSLTPVNDSLVGELFPLNTNEELQSEDSVSIPSFSEDCENSASGAAVCIKKAIVLESNCSTSLEEVIVSKCGIIDSSLDEGNLRQALFNVTQKKDELEEQNRSLRSLMEKEMEMCATLRVENEDHKRKYQDKLDKFENKMQTLSRENELLKHQLRKYVGAVQMLKREGTQPHEVIVDLNRDGQLSGSDGRVYIDYHLESTEYEKKLIQVAEMHGELMEFNERLHRLLSQKEQIVRRLREELVDLRGPLPDDGMTSDDDISITSDYDASSMTTASRALINVWIPSAFLTGKSSDVHHVYQIYIRIRDDEWNIYRRYAQFYALHKDLKRMDPIVNSFEFPPKKVLGNKDAKFVEKRRKRLQHYLRCVINLMVQSNADLTANPDKETLTALLPFFGEFANPAANRSRNRQRLGPDMFTRGQTVNSASSQVTPQYTGL